MEPSSTSTYQPPRACSALRLVVVDDDRTFRGGLAANLRDDGHVVDEYAAPEDVTDRTTLDAVGVVVTDYQMERVNGLTFADAVHGSHPAIAIVMVTAYATADLETQVAARPFLRLCRKPVDYDDLHDLIHALAPSP